jgi:protein KRI1
LTPEEILLADDALLNEHVSMKKLAPYLPEEVQERNERRYSKKRRVFEFRRKLHERLRAQAQEQYQSNPSSHDEHPRKKRKKTKSE